MAKLSDRLTEKQVLCKVWCSSRLRESESERVAKLSDRLTKKEVLSKKCGKTKDDNDLHPKESGRVPCSFPSVF